MIQVTKSQTIYQIPKRKSDPITVDKMGYCMCDCATPCPLGRIGIDSRCDKEILELKGYETVLYNGHNSPSQKRKAKYDCEEGEHVWQPLPDYEDGNVCVHCGVKENG